MIRIDRCICTGQTFATLTARAAREGWTFEQTCDQTNASRNCGLCRPYLRTALQTGQVVFHQVLHESEPTASE